MEKVLTWTWTWTDGEEERVSDTASDDDGSKKSLIEVFQSLY